MLESFRKSFGNIFRLIDDLTPSNVCDEVERSFLKIHPLELELKKESLGLLGGSFPDLMITIKDKKFSLKLFDKKGSFSFSITSMLYLDSGIAIFCCVFVAEILRSARATDSTTIIQRNSFLISQRN